MKFFCRTSPGNFDFFFQKQPAFGVKNFLDYWHNCCVAFLANERHFENLAANWNSLNIGMLAKKVFVD